MTRRFPFALLLAITLLSPALLKAQAEDEAHYTPPAGEAPPVAPPLKKGSPLERLANTPKQPTPTIGAKVGKTGSSDFVLGHRFADPQGGCGWGWIKKDGAGWFSAKWVVLQDTPGVAAVPHRTLVAADADSNWEYRLWGHMASYKAYDPHLDEMLPVFVLTGYEVIGPAPELTNKVGPAGRVQHRPSGASSRSNRPIMSDPGYD